MKGALSIMMKIAVLIGVTFVSYVSVLQVRGQPASTITDRYSDEGCDTLRGCFMCDTCNANVAWEPLTNVDMVRFNLWGPRSGTTGYVAMGISLDKQMPLSNIYACVVNNGVNELQSYRSAARGERSRIPLKGVNNITIQLENEIIRCEFDRDMSPSDGDTEFYDISGNNQNYILLASEGSLSNGEISYHSSTRGVSEPVQLSHVNNSSGTGNVTVTTLMTTARAGNGSSVTGNIDMDSTTSVTTVRADDGAGTRNMAVVTIPVASSLLALVVTDRLSNARSLRSFTTLGIMGTAVLMFLPFI